MVTVMVTRAGVESVLQRIQLNASEFGKILSSVETDDIWPIETLVFDVLCSAVCLTFGYFWLKAPSMRPKQVAWILSAITSLTCSTLSFYHVHKLAVHNWDINTLIFTDDRLSRFTICFFITYLVLDLVFGVMHYREHVQLLSGWLHHIFYIGTLVWALSSHFCVGFCFFFPLEIPSFILALGTLYPERRTDLGFGFTFFATRLVYHSMLFKLMVEMENPRVPVWPVAAIALVVHCYWFYGWIISFKKRVKERKKGQGQADKSKGLDKIKGV
jgi:hypothetical protein